MTLSLAAVLLAFLAIAALFLPQERQRLVRGFRALHSVMGTQFLIACGLVLALFCAALLRHQGPLALVMALIAFIVCIRAHDAGDEDDPVTEYQAFWDRNQWTEEERAAMAARSHPAHRFNQLRTGDEAPHRLPLADDAEHRRFAAGLGLNHAGSDL